MWHVTLEFHNVSESRVSSEILEEEQWKEEEKSDH